MTFFRSSQPWDHDHWRLWYFFHTSFSHFSKKQLIPAVLKSFEAIFTFFPPFIKSWRFAGKIRKNTLLSYKKSKEIIGRYYNKTLWWTFWLEHIVTRNLWIRCLLYWTFSYWQNPNIFEGNVILIDRCHSVDNFEHYRVCFSGFSSLVQLEIAEPSLLQICIW